MYNLVLFNLVYILYEIQSISFNIISNHLISTKCDKRMNRLTAKPLFLILLQSQSFAVRTKYSILWRVRLGTRMIFLAQDKVSLMLLESLWRIFLVSICCAFFEEWSCGWRGNLQKLSDVLQVALCCLVDPLLVLQQSDPAACTCSFLSFLCEIVTASKMEQHGPRWCSLCNNKLACGGNPFFLLFLGWDIGLTFLENESLLPEETKTLA